MIDIAEFEVTAPAETAIKKLSKAKIPVYKLKKRAGKLYFGVNKEYIEKVFAIFAHPCYNIRIRCKSRSMRIANAFARRAGFFVGAAVFVALACLSQTVVFKIKVTGSGNYLTPQVMHVANECGAREWSMCRSLDKPLLQAKLLSLPGVNFCSVQREGAYLIININADESSAKNGDNKALLSPADGVIKKIVAVCGTAVRGVGDAVKRGETLICAYTVGEDGQKRDCLLVGFAEIEVSATISLAYDSENEENAKSALSSTSLYSDKVTEKSYKVKNREGGVTYEVSFKYLITAAVNME